MERRLTNQRDNTGQHDHPDWGEKESQCSLIFFSFVTKDIEHCFMYLLAICTSLKSSLLGK
jgi:hypothetical protein